MLKTVPEGWISAGVVEKSGCHDQLSYQFRVPDCDLQRDRPAVAESKEISLFDAEIVQEFGGVIGGTLEAEGPVGNVCRVSESLLLKCDDPAAALIVA